ncbi:MAG: hypothetical protein ACOYVG_05580 [Bacteroidota bacterium]
MHTTARYKPYREARVFSDSELLFMEIQACILFTASSRPWWKRLSAGEKYRVLYAEKKNSSFVKDFTSNSTLIQEV